MRPKASFRHGLPAELVPLVANARHNPEDDFARLVVADWLEEQGPPPERARGTFIRLQVQLSRLPLDAHAQRAPLAKQANNLRRQHRRDWLGELGRARGLARYDFVRGFVQLHVTEEVVPYGGLDYLSRLPTWPWVDGLSCDAWLDGRSCQAILRSAALADLSSLALGATSWQGHSVWVPYLRALLHSPHVTNLHTLDLNYHRCGPARARDLADSPYLARLRVLFLSNNDIEDQGAVALALSPNLPALARLSLWRNQIGDEGARALLESPHRQNLRQLNLTQNHLSESTQEAVRRRFGPNSA